MALFRNCLTQLSKRNNADRDNDYSWRSVSYSNTPVEIIMFAENLERTANRNIQRFFLHLALAIVAMIMFSVSHPVQAQGILDAGKGMLGGSSSGVPGVGGATGIAGALPLDKIMSLVQQQGYSNITGLMPSSSGDALQASATNSSGSPVNLLINPMTGGVISALAK